VKIEPVIGTFTPNGVTPSNRVTTTARRLRPFQRISLALSRAIPLDSAPSFSEFRPLMASGFQVALMDPIRSRFHPLI
jgi:hypothetical protein